MEAFHIVTVRNSSCGKVTFLHFSVSHSLHTGGGGVADTAPRQTPPGRHTPLGRHPPPHRWPLQRTVRILLECILVRICETSKIVFCRAMCKTKCCSKQIRAFYSVRISEISFRIRTVFEFLCLTCIFMFHK